jgi:hypothetical protein
VLRGCCPCCGMLSLATVSATAAGLSIRLMNSASPAHCRTKQAQRARETSRRQSDCERRTLPDPQQSSRMLWKLLEPCCDSGESKHFAPTAFTWLWSAYARQAGQQPRCLTAKWKSCSWILKRIKSRNFPFCGNLSSMASVSNACS